VEAEEEWRRRFGRRMGVEGMACGEEGGALAEGC